MAASAPPRLPSPGRPHGRPHSLRRVEAMAASMGPGPGRVPVPIPVARAAASWQQERRRSSPMGWRAARVLTPWVGTPWVGGTRVGATPPTAGLPNWKPVGASRWTWVLARSPLRSAPRPSLLPPRPSRRACASARPCRTRRCCLAPGLEDWPTQPRGTAVCRCCPRPWWAASVRTPPRCCAQVCALREAVGLGSTSRHSPPSPAAARARRSPIQCVHRDGHWGNGIYKYRCAAVRAWGGGGL